MDNCYVYIKNPEEEFNKLLSVKDPGEYILRINSNYVKYMDNYFWYVLAFRFYRIYFVVFLDTNDILYEYENIYRGGKIIWKKY